MQGLEQAHLFTILPVGGLLLQLFRHKDAPYTGTLLGAICVHLLFFYVVADEIAIDLAVILFQLGIIG